MSLCLLTSIIIIRSPASSNIDNTVRHLQHRTTSDNILGPSYNILRHPATLDNILGHRTTSCDIVQHVQHNITVIVQHQRVKLIHICENYNLNLNPVRDVRKILLKDYDKLLETISHCKGINVTVVSLQ